MNQWIEKAIQRNKEWKIHIRQISFWISSLGTIRPPGNYVDRWLRYITSNATLLAINGQHMLTIVRWWPRLTIVIASIDGTISRPDIVNLLIIMHFGKTVISIRIEIRYSSCCCFCYICRWPVDCAWTMISSSKEVVLKGSYCWWTKAMFKWKEWLKMHENKKLKMAYLWKTHVNNILVVVRKHIYLENEVIFLGWSLIVYRFERLLEQWAILEAIRQRLVNPTYWNKG